MTSPDCRTRGARFATWLGAHLWPVMFIVLLALGLLGLVAFIIENHNRRVDCEARGGAYVERAQSLNLFGVCAVPEEQP